jgi:hypothetical protein
MDKGFPSSAPCVQSKEKKASTHTSHTIQQNFVAKGWVSIYSQRRVFYPGSWYEPGPMLRREPRATQGGHWSRFMPQTGTDSLK